MVSRAKMRAMLTDWGNVGREISRMQRDIREFSQLRDDAYNALRAQNLDGMPRGSGTGDPTARAAALAAERAEMLCDKIARDNERIRALLQMKEVMDENVRRLTAMQRRILHLKYERGYKWYRVTQIVHYSDAQVRLIETAAVDILRALVK